MTIEFLVLPGVLSFRICYFYKLTEVGNSKRDESRICQTDVSRARKNPRHGGKRREEEGRGGLTRARGLPMPR